MSFADRLIKKLQDDSTQSANNLSVNIVDFENAVGRVMHEVLMSLRQVYPNVIVNASIGSTYIQNASTRIFEFANIKPGLISKKSPRLQFTFFIQRRGDGSFLVALTNEVSSFYEPKKEYTLIHTPFTGVKYENGVTHEELCEYIVTQVESLVEDSIKNIKFDFFNNF